jgi:hypothetical protein
LIAAVIAVVLIVGLIGVGVNALYTHYVNDINYNACCGGKFDFADRASDIDTKIDYMTQYITAIETEKLNEGCNSVYNCHQIAAQNAENYKIAKSLLTRMQENKNIQSDTARIYDLQTVIWTEFCWFPDQAFQQAYQIKHNGWGDALFPPAQENHCVSSGSSTARPPPPTS